MKKLINRSLVSAYIVIVLLSCEAKPEYKNREDQLIDSVNNKYKNSKINYSSLAGLKSINHESVFYNNGKKLISIFDADCSACIVDLNNWQRMLDSIKIKETNINVAFFAYSSDSLRTTFTINTEAKFLYPTYYLPDSRFISENNLVHDSYFQTYLVGIEDNIVFIGSPVKSERLQVRFLGEFNKFIKY